MTARQRSLQIIEVVAEFVTMFFIFATPWALIALYHGWTG